jgi:hypothetical protein
MDHRTDTYRRVVDAGHQYLQKGQKIKKASFPGGFYCDTVFPDHWPLTWFTPILKLVTWSFFHRNIRTKNGCKKSTGNKVHGYFQGGEPEFSKEKRIEGNWIIRNG